MTSSEFERVLDQLVQNLTNQAREKEVCLDSKQFEKIVLDELNTICQEKAESVKPAFHQHAFPDLIVNGFGVEVKHTIKDSWHAVGNSVFEGMRDLEARQIYVVYGKMGGYPEVKWARYEDCITHVRISHAPRFVIDMQDSSRFFNSIGIEYHDFSKLSPVEKMKLVRQYARDRLRKGEILWWLEDLKNTDVSSSPSVRMYRHLKDSEKRQMRAEGALLFPEIVQPSHKRGKYDRVGLYLMTKHGVFASQLRDLYSAGSVGARDGSRGHKYIVVALRDIENEMRQAARDLDDSLFEAYWGEACKPENRIAVWLSKADEYATDWVPSEMLFGGKDS